MDYKELLERLRKYADFGDKLIVCAEAATAIETLLAEREDIVNGLKGMCQFCKHEEISDAVFCHQLKISTCKYVSEVGELMYIGKCPHWEWRVPHAP